MMGLERLVGFSDAGGQRLRFVETGHDDRHLQRGVEAAGRLLSRKTIRVSGAFHYAREVWSRHANHASAPGGVIQPTSLRALVPRSWSWWWPRPSSRCSTPTSFT